MSATVHPPWSLDLTRFIGAEVRGHRMRQGKTVQALATKCAGLGLPLGRVTITKLERGNREHVSVPELIVLAAALDVPPLSLIFPSAHLPAGLDQQREVLPGHIVALRDAARWFAGSPDKPLLGEIRAQVEVLAKLTAGRGEL